MHKKSGVCDIIGIDPSSKFQVPIAKNGGRDDSDQKTLSRLQVWLRAVSQAQQPPLTQTGRLWIGDSGLLGYPRGRLYYHITQINQSSGVVAALEAEVSVHGPLIDHLQCLCGRATYDSTVQ